MENHWIYGHSILKQNQILIFRFFSCVSSTFAGEYIRHGFAVNSQSLNDIFPEVYH